MALTEMANKYDRIVAYNQPSHKHVDPFGGVQWFLRGTNILHRVDGPAVVSSNGRHEWHRLGKLHRDDGPAVEDGSNKMWFVNGELHRLDGPAIERADGVKEWWVNGFLHRLDGPAIIAKSGNREWYVNGRRHREDGPAVEYSNGDVLYYIDGLSITPLDFKIRMGLNDLAKFKIKQGSPKP